MVFMSIRGTVISIQIALSRYPITVSPPECGEIKYVISSNIVEDRSDDLLPFHFFVINCRDQKRTKFHDKP